MCDAIQTFRNTENALAHLPEASVARTCGRKNDAVLISVPLTVPKPQVHPSQEEGAVRQHMRAGAGSRATPSDSSTTRVRSSARLPYVSKATHQVLCNVLLAAS